MTGAVTSIPLESLGVLRVRGADAVSFLQGQLSNDLARLTPQRSLLAGYHNPQGRVLALLRLLELARDDLIAVLPRELSAPIVQRLAKFVLRAQVRLGDESALWAVAGLVSAGPPAAQPTPACARWQGLPDEPDGVARADDSIVVRLPGARARWLAVGPAGRSGAAAAPALLELWQRLAIEAGEPQVYAATSGEFVAQMLNLDALGAIAFEKGCYTGQEVIARAHYRGRVKRRLQRFVVQGSAGLAPGTAAELADGRAVRVVDAVQRADGSCEFLAVAPLQADPGASAAPPSARILAARQLALPYPLPE